MHQIFDGQNNPRTQGTWSEASGAGTAETGSLDVQISLSCFVTVLCASSSHFEKLGDVRITGSAATPASK